MKLNRKPIQIAVSQDISDSYTTLYTICDDGSIWRRCPDDIDAKWERIPDVPKDR